MKNSVYIFIFIVFNCITLFSQEINFESKDNIGCNMFLKLSIDSLLVDNQLVKWGDKRPYILYKIELDDSSKFTKIKIVNIEKGFNKNYITSILYDIDYSCLMLEFNIEDIKPIGFFVSYRNGTVGNQ